MKVRVPSHAVQLAVLTTCALVGAGSLIGAAPGRSRVSAPLLGIRPVAANIRLVPAPEGNEARFRVREQLARIDFPSDAVGVTSAITGALVLGANGAVVRDSSRFVVDLTTLKSDSRMRDGFIKRRTLETDQYPSAEFVPTAIHGIAGPLPTTGEFSLQLQGDMTVHGVTHPVSWAVQARAVEDGYTGQATTDFKFEDFHMAIPRVRSVLSVKDSIRLEYDFHLIRAGGS